MKKFGTVCQTIYQFEELEEYCKVLFQRVCKSLGDVTLLQIMRYNNNTLIV